MASTRKIFNQFEEITITTSDILGQIGDILPENNYWIFSTYTIIVPRILEEFSHLILPQSGIIGPIWNYLDAGCSIIAGFFLIFNAKKNSRPNATKAKGAAQVLNGTQLTIFTAINFTVFGGPAFAAAFFIGFVLSLDETIRAKKKLDDNRYWLQDTLMQIKKLDELIPELNKDIEEMQSILQQRGEGFFSNWALQAKIKRRDEFINKKIHLEEDTDTRICSMTAQNKPMDDIVNTYLETVPAYSTEFNERLKSFMQDKKDHYDEIVENCNKQCKTMTQKKKEMKIKKECEESYNNAEKDTCIWFFAFVGMALLCIPGCQSFGITFIGVASFLYLKKNASRIISSFFKPAGVEENLPEKTSQRIDHKHLRHIFR